MKNRWRNWRGRRRGLWKNGWQNDWRCKWKAEQEEEERQRVDWTDMDVHEPVDGMATCVDLGGSVEIEGAKAARQARRAIGGSTDERGRMELARRREDGEQRGGTQRATEERCTQKQKEAEHRKQKIMCPQTHILLNMRLS